jgi:hypothetical protein
MEKKDFEKQLDQSSADKRMDLAHWRASRRHEMDLPSGLHVVIKDIDMTDLVLTGKLPSSILTEAKKAAEVADVVDLEKMALELMEKDGPDFKKMIDAIAAAALLEPAVGPIADDTHITIDELTTDDKLAIMGFVNREVDQLRSFRPGQEQSVATIQHGDGLRDEA